MARPSCPPVVKKTCKLTIAVCVPTSMIVLVRFSTVRFDQRWLLWKGSVFRRANRAALHGERFFKATGVQQRVVPEDLQGWAVRHDFAFMQHYGALAELKNHVEIMAGYDTCMMEALEQGDKQASSIRVEAVGRFIEHQNLWQH